MKQRLKDCWRLLTGGYEAYTIISLPKRDVPKIQRAEEWTADVQRNGIDSADFYFILLAIVDGLNREIYHDDKTPEL